MPIRLSYPPKVVTLEDCEMALDGEYSDRTSALNLMVGMGLQNRPEIEDQWGPRVIR
jgi:hypothetical protein